MPADASGEWKTSSGSSLAFCRRGWGTRVATFPMRPTATTRTMPRRSRSSSTRSRRRIARSSGSSSRSTTRRRVNRQGNDVGTSYRSAIFYLDDEQRRIAEDTIAEVDSSGRWPGKVVTELAPGGAVLGGRAGAPGLPRALSRTATPATSSGRHGCCRAGQEQLPASGRQARSFTCNVRLGAAPTPIRRRKPRLRLPTANRVINA